MRDISEASATAPADVLDALEGVCYVMGRDRKITMIGGRNWRALAEASGAPRLANPDPFIGQSLEDFVTGDEVAAWYNECFDLIERGERDPVAFIHRCDSPSLRREARLSISGIRDGKTLKGFLVQNLVLSEQERPPISLFDPEKIADAMRGDTTLPIILLCSVCHRIRTQDEPPVWIEAEHYYRDGGSGDVRVSHGLCPDCAGYWKHQAS